jgi:beta-glucanase (GH16 family)
MRVGIFLCLISLGLLSCNKSGGTPPALTPSNLVVNATVNPDKSGNVSFVSSATNAANYEYDFGNGVFETIPSGSVQHKYKTSGNYTVKVTAKSSSGATISKSIDIAVTVAMALVWSDEFDTPGAPNSNKWGYDLGASGWGNNESQYYTDRRDNSYVTDGTLKIVAKKEAFSSSQYTSARLLSKGKYSFKYGKVEVRAKIPAGVGTWPAIWMLGDNINTVSWPACGEIDIMEHVGKDLNKIISAFHYPVYYGGNAKVATTMVPTATTEFHVYKLEWTPTAMQIFVDDKLFHTLQNSPSIPYNQNFFMILNIAMGGNLGGPIDASFTSTTFEIDYVRVYQ